MKYLNTVQMKPYYLWVMKAFLGAVLAISIPLTMDAYARGSDDSSGSGHGGHSGKSGSSGSSGGAGIIVDTNAGTICTGEQVLNGEGNCVPLPEGGGPTTVSECRPFEMLIIDGSGGTNCLSVVDECPCADGYSAAMQHVLDGSGFGALTQDFSSLPERCIRNDEGFHNEIDLQASGTFCRARTFQDGIRGNHVYKDISTDEVSACQRLLKLMCNSIPAP